MLNLFPEPGDTGNTYSLTITAGTGGRITTGRSGTYEEGSVITIAAKSNSGYSFKGWLSTDGGTFANAKEASTTYTMPANETTITATFTYIGFGGDGSNNGGGETTSTPTPTPTPMPTEPTDPVNPTKPRIPKVELTDIANHLARASIEKSVELGFVSGYEDGTFSPNRSVTRGEVATMLAKALKLDPGETEYSFADKDQTPAWVRPFIQSIAKAGFIVGYKDGTFRSNNKISRTELVVMIVRALGLEVNPNATLMFDDADQIPAWARPYVATAAEAGLIKGDGNGKFNPNAFSTRAEAVTLILAMLDNVK
ncbi:S-layer homology domain-containing protein [Paenibacillus terrigena]|uniref:S-layer homology domain-containing protein n=1 Tax=Paenibacillus terrigena TaxID=369333 RepID=UPI0003AA8256|nr:S-layer homology domain-containing protein [Paenibacillus terrigena]